MLQDIRAQLEYLSPPVADILECLCRRESLRRLTFLQDCRTSMQNGLNFPDAWQAALSGRQEELRGEDCEKLLAFGAGFGTTDLSGQLAGCALCSEMLGEQLTHAREAFRTYGKLYPMLGMLTGIALAVAVL